MTLREWLLAYLEHAKNGIPIEVVMSMHKIDREDLLKLVDNEPDLQHDGSGIYSYWDDRYG
jgi:hypothetical protein